MRIAAIVQAIETQTEQRQLTHAIADHLPARPVIQAIVIHATEEIQADNYGALVEAGLLLSALREGARDLELAMNSARCAQQKGTL